MMRWAAPVLPLAVAACDLQRADWGLGAIDSMTTPPDPPLVCGAPIAADQRSELRACCTYGAGALASESLGVDASVLGSVPIRHVIVVMKENRSLSMATKFEGPAVTKFAGRAASR